jgi:hypothetical protein
MRRANEIYPAKVYVVDVFDLYGVFEKRLKDPYPSTSYSYYDSVKEAQEDINWRKQNRPNQFEKGDKFKIHAIPFNEAYPGVYGYPHGGRRYNKEQVKKLIAQRDEESASSDDGSSSIPWDVTDEIEGRDQNNIFWKAFYGEKNKNITDREAYNRAYKAVKEYQEGIEDRKKTPTETKIKRAINKTDKKLKKIYGLENVGERANKVISVKTTKKNLDSKTKKTLAVAVPRKKKVTGKPKRKVIKKRK